MSTKEALELIEKVNALYSGAMSQLTTLYTESMNQLIMITVSVLAIVGVIIPALVAWLQSRQLNREQKLLKSEIDNQVQLSLQKLQTQFATEFASKSLEIQSVLDEYRKNFKKELERLEASSDARTLHLQAQQYWSSKLYADSLQSAVSAMTYYVKSQDESNLLRVWKIANFNFPQINKKSFQEHIELEEKITEAINAMSSINANGRYADLIVEIKKNLKDAKER